MVHASKYGETTGQGLPQVLVIEGAGGRKSNRHEVALTGFWVLATKHRNTLRLHGLRYSTLTMWHSC